MATLKAVQSNTAPIYQITCQRDDGSIIDLTATTVTLKLYFSTTQTNVGHEACTVVVPATNGTFTWEPKTGDLPNAGTYKGDVHVTYADNTVEVLYDNVELKVRRLLG